MVTGLRDDVPCDLDGQWHHHRAELPTLPNEVVLAVAMQFNSMSNAIMSPFGHHVALGAVAV